MIYLTSSSARISSSSILSVSENVRVLAVFFLLLSVSVSVSVLMVTPLRWAGVLRPLLSSASAAAARAAALASRTWRCFRTWSKHSQQKSERTKEKSSNIKGERGNDFFSVPASNLDTICTVNVDTRPVLESDGFYQIYMACKRSDRKQSTDAGKIFCMR